MSRKLTTFLQVGALCFGLTGGAYAQYNPNGEALPPGASEEEVFLLDAVNGWQSLGPTGQTNVLARSWNSGGASGNCNRASWTTTFTNHASIAQWLDWELASTRKDWRIRKPGQYASDSIHFSIASNNAVVISFDGFDDLQYLNPDAPDDTTNYIPTYYSYGSGIADAEANGWIPAADLNDMVVTFENSNPLHYGLEYKLWSRLNVVNSNSSSEYENTGTIMLALTNLKFWIDGPTGQFTQHQFGDPPTDPYVAPTI